jgi:RecB family exonuclease
MRLSYSRLATFLNCGFLYRLRYIERIPARPKPHLGFGRILHSALSRFYNLKITEPSLNDLLRLYRSFWKNEGETYKRYYTKGTDIFKRYFELNIENYHKVVYVEQPFEIPVGGHILAGRFDRVDRLDDNSYEIIDYKVASKVATQSEIDTDLQLGIYGLAFKLTTGKMPLLSFYFLPKNVKVTSLRTDREIFRIKSGLDSVVDKLMGGEHFAPQECIECKWCDYKKYCPVKTENPMPLPVRERQPDLILDLNSKLES